MMTFSTILVFSILIRSTLMMRSISSSMWTQGVRLPRTTTTTIIFEILK